jgi:hypothetical protein
MSGELSSDATPLARARAGGVFLHLGPEARLEDNVSKRITLIFSPSQDSYSRDGHRVQHRNRRIIIRSFHIQNSIDDTSRHSYSIDDTSRHSSLTRRGKDSAVRIAKATVASAAMAAMAAKAARRSEDGGRGGRRRRGRRAEVRRREDGGEGDGGDGGVCGWVRRCPCA